MLMKNAILNIFYRLNMISYVAFTCDCMDEIVARRRDSRD